MKQLFSVLATVLVLASCSSTSEQKPEVNNFSVSLKKDTGYVANIAQTAPRFTCAGKALPQPKLTGFVKAWSPLLVTADTTITNAEMNKAGWYWFSSSDTPVKTTTSFSWFPGWLRDFLEVLFWIVGIALALWLLWEILSALFRNLSSTRAAAPVVTQPAKAVPVSVQSAAANTAGTTGTTPLVIISGSHNAIGDIIINMGTGTIRVSSDTYDDHRPGPHYSRQSAGGQHSDRKE